MLEQHGAEGPRGGVVGADTVAPELDVVVGGGADGAEGGFDVEEVVFVKDAADLGDEGGRGVFGVGGPPEVDVACGGVEEAEEGEDGRGEGERVVFIELGLGVVERVGEVGVDCVEDVGTEVWELEAEGEQRGSEVGGEAFPRRGRDLAEERG